jgi:hypothetical protein
MATSNIQLNDDANPARATDAIAQLVWDPTNRRWRPLRGRRRLSEKRLINKDKDNSRGDRRKREALCRRGSAHHLGGMLLP